jgi:hypothetical protein
MDIITRLINKFGKPAQVLQAIEEMSELIKELLKNVNRGEKNRDKILEEHVQVKFALEQIEEMYSFSPEEIEKEYVKTLKKVKEYL